MRNHRDLDLPAAVASAIAEGVQIVRAYRDFLGYSVEQVAVSCGLTIEEIERIEAGYRFDKGYRERIARALALPPEIFEAEQAKQDAA